VEPTEAAVLRERLCRHHVTVGCRGDSGNAKTKELWETVSSVRSVQRLCKESQLGLLVSSERGRLQTLQSALASEDKGRGTRKVRSLGRWEPSPDDNQ
jgi:hypothetical protein